MGADAHSAVSFYGSARGGVACRLVRRKLLQIWPDLSRQAVLGLGFTSPYLRAWRGQAARCIAASPVQVAALRWPTVAPNLACAVEEHALPFPDLSFDRVLLAHGLELAESPRAVLREVWRVLRDDGRLLVVTPNRIGLWAQIESTPFGHGQPYSSGQIGRLLTDQSFRVERRECALYVPPTRWRLVLRGARLWEQVGRAVLPQLGGVTITEAIKDSYAAVPVQRAKRLRRLLGEVASSVQRSAPPCAPGLPGSKLGACAVGDKPTGPVGRGGGAACAGGGGAGAGPGRPAATGLGPGRKPPPFGGPDG